MTLGFSRRLFACFVFDQRVETWLLCHVRAFEHFGGVPAVVVPGNLKAGVVRCCIPHLIGRAPVLCGTVLSNCGAVLSPRARPVVRAGAATINRELSSEAIYHMPSTFPGTEPPLEQADLGPDARCTLIAAIRAVLTPRLPKLRPRYVVRLGKREAVPKFQLPLPDGDAEPALSPHDETWRRGVVRAVGR